MQSRYNYPVMYRCVKTLYIPSSTRWPINDLQPRYSYRGDGEFLEASTVSICGIAMRNLVGAVGIGLLIRGGVRVNVREN